MSLSTPSSLIFPESSSFVKKDLSNRKISFRYLIVVLYIYGGVHGLVWLLSKTVLTPLFQQLIHDRREYHQRFLDLLVNFNIKLSSLVSYIPPSIVTWESPTGSKYSDAQTQTDDNIGEETNGEDSSNSSLTKNQSYSYNYYSNSISNSISAVPEGLERKKKKKSKKNNLVKFGQTTANAAVDASGEVIDGTVPSLSEDSGSGSEDDSDYDEVRTPAEKADLRNEEFTRTLKYTSNRVTALELQSTLGLVNPVKYQLEDLTSSLKSLESGDSASARNLGTIKTRRQTLDDIKKEIRSFKGSFLNARSFPAVRR